MLSRRRIIIAMAALTAASPAASLAARAAASCPRLQAERRAPLQQDFMHACGRCWDGSHWNYGGRRYTAAEYGRYWSKHYEERREPKKPSGPAKPPQHPQQKPGPQAGRNPPKGLGHDNGRHEGRKNDGRRDNWDGPR